MKFGVMFANVGPMAHAEGAIGIAQAAEAGGIESLWTVEHTVVPAGYQSAYPYSDTGKMPGPDDSADPRPAHLAQPSWPPPPAPSGSAPGILILPQRNPVTLAKEVATLDQLSGGRVELGIGVGWLEEEFDAIGVPFADRGKRTDDHVAALRALWAGDPATHDGRVLVVHRRLLPPGAHPGQHPDRRRRPQQGRRPPGRPARRRVLPRARAATRSWPSSSTSCARPPSSTAATPTPSRSPPAATAPSAAAPSTRSRRWPTSGVSRVIIPPLAFDVEGQKDAFAKYGEDVISRC